MHFINCGLIGHGCYERNTGWTEVIVESYKEVMKNSTERVYGNFKQLVIIGCQNAEMKGLFQYRRNLHYRDLCVVQGSLCSNYSDSNN